MILLGKPETLEVHVTVHVNGQPAAEVSASTTVKGRRDG